jgi:hypothetical protein
VIAENPEVAERVLERIRADGPLSSLDFERERGSTTDWFGMQMNTVRAARGHPSGPVTSRPSSRRPHLTRPRKRR